MLWFQRRGWGANCLSAVDPSQYPYCLSQALTVRLLFCHHVKIGTTDVVLVNLQSRRCRSGRPPANNGSFGAQPGTRAH